MVLIKNIQTKREYPVSDKAWEEIVAKGKGKLFTVVKQYEQKTVKLGVMPIAPPEVTVIKKGKGSAQKGSKKDA